MHLLTLDNGNDELSLVKDFHDGNIPPYAILSHTWGKPQDEVTFDDVTSRRGMAKLGYRKIQFCAVQAKKDGLQYFWVDTCCINKANLAELQESITLMFGWYQRAVKCYVYLDDIPTDHLWEPLFRNCKWFTRGWTLQELLAPIKVEFFSRDNQLLGSKATLSHLIQEITGIPLNALQGITPLSEFSPKVKIQWASSRQTTKPEDRVYCLLGIFDVYLLPHYGEREYAWERFKREVGASYENQITELRSAPNVPSVHSFASHDKQQNFTLRSFQRALDFDQMYSRQATIGAVHSTTCVWLLQSRQYLDWMDPNMAGQDHRVLWIKGKPGVGKSTLIKYAYSQTRKSRDDEVILSYFFNARGSSLEKSTVGMYRALLSQSIQQMKNPQQAEALEKALKEVLQYTFDNMPSFDHHRPHTWDLESLRQLFACAIGKVSQPRLRCYIDALDECDEQEIREMVAHLEDLMQTPMGQKLYVCFASRHYPSIMLRHGVEVIVEKERGHGADLTKYIEDRLQIGRNKSQTSIEIQAQVKHKANGVFLWAVLVINLLNMEYRNGRIYALRRRLEEIPTELNLLFKDILCKDDTNIDDLLLCIQWILFAERPLTPTEFYCAMMAGLDVDPIADIERDSDVLSEDTLRRFVASSSKGLAELTQSEQADNSREGTATITVQFIHESVRDFLIKDGGLYEMWPQFRAESDSRSHDRLRRYCQGYLNTAFEKCAPTLPHRDEYQRRFPLLRYAAASAFYHAEKAAKSMSQEDLLTGPYIHNWYLVQNHHDTSDTYDRRPIDSALYHVSSSGYHEITSLLISRGANVDARGPTRHGNTSALYIASKSGFQDVVRLLLTKGAKVNLQGSRFSYDNALVAASEQGHREVVKLLLDTIDVKEDVNGNALLAATESDHAEVVKLLLDAGADPNAGKVNYGKALYTASAGDLVEIARLLIDAGADVNIRGGWYHNTVLHVASIEGHVEMVKLLIDAGADVDKRGGWFQNDTALYAASIEGHVVVVKLLIDAGAAMH